MEKGAIVSKDDEESKVRCFETSPKAGAAWVL